MVKFKSRYPNVCYAGCMFNDKKEFIANERQAEALRGLKDLMTTHDIEEVNDEPTDTETDVASTRYAELHKKGWKSLDKDEKEEYQKLKKALGK